MQVLKTLISIIFPTYCIGCGAEGVLACATCISQARPAPPSDDLCCISLFSYRDPVIRQALSSLKDHTLIPHLFQPLKEASLPLVGTIALFSEEPLVVVLPIPHMQGTRHKYKNVLAKEASTILGYPAVSGILIRSKEKPETFLVKNKSLIENAICILVDDVMRTGATIKSARAALTRAGARGVYAITIAR